MPNTSLEINCIQGVATSTCTIAKFDGFFLWPMSILFILILILFVQILNFTNPWK